MDKPPLDSSYVFDPGADHFLIGVMFLRVPGTLTVRNAPARGQSVSFRVEAGDWALRPTAITVASLEGEEITSTDLRAVNAKNLWRSAIIRHIEYLAKGDEENPLQLSDEKLENLRLRGPEPETLEHVADLYSLAQALGLPPSLYVQEAFAGKNLEPLPRSTATKWIKRARDDGWINERVNHNGDD